MRLVGLVGLPGSGKSEAATVATNHGFNVIQMGTVVRDEVERRDLPLTDDNIAAVSESLRAEHGDAAIAKLVLERISTEEKTVIDGIRGPSEVQRFREASAHPFTLIAIKAPREVRFSRIADRQRKEDIQTVAELRARDKREREWGLEKAMETADVTIENTGSLAEFRSSVAETLQTVEERHNHSKD